MIRERTTTVAMHLLRRLLDGRARTERLFVALDLPAGARAALAAFRDRADPSVWRPVADEALHVTLVFLGHRPEGESARSRATSCARARVRRLTSRSGRRCCCRRAGRACCAREVVDGSGALAALQARLVAALAEAGLHEPERRRFRPHATVARLRAGARSPRTPRGSRTPSRSSSRARP